MITFNQAIAFECANETIFILIHRWLNSKFKILSSCPEKSFSLKYNSISMRSGMLGFSSSEWYSENGFKVYIIHSYGQFLRIMETHEAALFSIWDF